MISNEIRVRIGPDLVQLAAEGLLKRVEWFGDNVRIEWRSANHEKIDGVLLKTDMELIAFYAGVNAAVRAVHGIIIDRLGDLLPPKRGVTEQELREGVLRGLTDSEIDSFTEGL